MQVVPQVVGTGRPTVTIEDTEEADLGPLDLKVLLALGLQYVQYDGDSVLVVVSDDALVSVRSVGLDHAALLLRRLRRLVVLQEERLRVQHRRVLSKEQRLHLHELDVGIL